MYLLDAPGPRLASEVRSGLEAYADLGDQAFYRQFERDKKLLRDLGVPLRTVEMPESEAGQGYTIDTGDFELPPIEFEPDEAMMVDLAARAWQAESLRTEAAGGLLKLRAAGALTDHRADAIITPLDTSDAGFDIVWRALLEGRRLIFTYRGVQRDVEPWRLVARHGSSYLVGHDRTRSAPRVFKLARMSDGPRPASAPGSVEMPDTATIDRALERLLDPDPARQEAIIAVRDGRRGTLVRGARPVAWNERWGSEPEGFTAWRVAHGSVDRFAATLAAAGSDVRVCEPAELRRAVIDHLDAVVEGAE